MALICDTSGIYALYDRSDQHHAEIAEFVAAEPGPLLLPVVLLAEIDYLLQSRLGQNAATDFMGAVAEGDFLMIPLSIADVARCRDVVSRYQDLQLGLADASIVVAAENLNVNRLLSLDFRHFRAIAPRNYSHFQLLPADEVRSST